MLSAVALASMLLAVVGEAPLDLDDCELKVAAAPEDTHAWSCFPKVGARDDEIEDALVRVHAHLDRDPHDGFARLYVGVLESMRGGARAEADFRAAIDELADGPHLEAEIFARVSLVGLLAVQGRHDEAEAELATARDVVHAIGDDRHVAAVDIFQAYLWTLRSVNLGNARELLLDAIAELDPESPRERGLAGLAYGTLGSVDRETGRVREAAADFERAAELAEADGNATNARRARYNAVMIAHEGDDVLTDADRAAFAPKLQALVADAVAAGDPYAEAPARHLLGRSLPPDDAREQFQLCLAAARGFVAESEHNCLLGLAELVAPEDLDGALAMTDEAYAIAERIGRPFEAMLALRVRHWITQQSAERPAAAHASFVYVAAAEAMRELHLGTDARTRVHAGWASAFRELAGALLGHDARAPEDVELAFNVLERMRARALLESLDAAGVPDPAAAIDVDGYFAIIARARAAAVGIDDRFPTPAAVQSRLADDQAMVSYVIAPDVDRLGHPGGGSWAIVLTRTDVRVVALPDGDGLARRARAYAGAFAGDRDPPAAAAERLGAELLAEALEDLPASIDELVIVADGELHRLPFASLRTTPGGPQLVERYRLSQVPSATLWLRWRDAAGERPRRPALVLADPAHGEAESDGPSVRAAGQGPLPGTRAEASAIAAHVGADTRVLVGPDATEAALRDAALDGYGIVHLAAHAVLDEARPDRSGIRLAASGAHDGTLRVSEIVGLDLGGKTVVLAACSSADGLALRGEGPMSVARGFFEAGATSVVASLWPLRDDVAAEIFDDVYAELARGGTLAAAVAEAQRIRIARGDPAAHWAGLVVLGDGRVTPLPREHTARPIALVGAGLGLVLVGAVLWWRRRGR
jgi:hypothetical protein